MKTILIDDEPYCLELLAHLLTRHCPEVHLVGQFTDPVEALRHLETHPAPDLVFSDVEMPRMNAFDLFNRLDAFSSHLIFTTAYDKYAIRAIKFSALDYLLKPIDIAELKTAVGKVHLQKRTRGQLPDMPPKSASPDRIALSTHVGIDFVSPCEILYCSSEGSYTEIHLLGGAKMMLSKPLKEVEELLPAGSFFRIHHSYSVNATHIRRYVRGAGGEVLMPNGKLLPVSRSRKESLLLVLGLSA